MPELPEVETVANDLHHYLHGKIVSDVELIDSSKVLQTPFNIFKKKTVGKKIKKIFRRAKMVVVDLGESVVLVHLKMTGQLIYVSKKTIVAGGHPITSTGINVPNKFTRVIFDIKGQGKLYFNDLRKFGWVKLISAEEFSELDQRLGLEPFNKRFTLAFFKKILSRRGRAPIKAALLDQTHLVGLGNIYVDEVLFRSKVRPARRIESLTEAEIKRIWQSIPVILSHSIRQRGTTFSNFLDPDGLRGNFMHHLKVYGRQGKPCFVCGRALRKTRVAGRGTHWCENCQR